MDPVQLRALSGILVILGLFLIRKGLRWAVRSRRRAGADERQADPDETGGPAADGGQTAEHGEAGDTGGFVFSDTQGEEDATNGDDRGGERGEDFGRDGNR